MIGGQQIPRQSLARTVCAPSRRRPVRRWHRERWRCHASAQIDAASADSAQCVHRLSAGALGQRMAGVAVPGRRADQRQSARAPRSPRSGDEPGIELARPADLLHAVCPARSASSQRTDALARSAQPRLVHACHAHTRLSARETGAPISSERRRLVQRLLEGAADGHRLAHDFICGPSVGSTPGNFSKAQRGILTTT